MALAAALSLTLAACSSDSDGDAAGTAVVDPATTPAATPAPTTGAPATDAAAPTGDPTTTIAATTTTAAAAQPVSADDVALEPFAELDTPIALAARGNEPDAVYVAERAGRIVRVGLDGTVGEVVLDISDDTSTDAERGLLGLAFHPDGGLLYVSFTDDDGNSQIDEYGIVDDGTVDTESRRTVLTQNQPFANHNGGHIAFGTDEMLYFGLGDGGAADDPQRSALDPSTLLGKLVRIDPTAPSDGLGYTVPDDNPFVGVDGARPEIWASGLRNPWRFSFDRANGDLWIGDVGQNVWEEIDHAPASAGGGRGLNFGWSAYEANQRFNDDQPADGATPPVFEYEHGDDGCSVTGGFVYRGAAVPELVGTYVFGDYCSGRIWGLQPAEDTYTRIDLAELGTLASFGEDATGELYAVSLGGEIRRFSPAS